MVIGPAYLDRVLLVDRPLHHPPGTAPFDQSVEGVWTFGDGLRFVDSGGSCLEVEPPPGWPGPAGVVGLRDPMDDLSSELGWKRSVRGVSWHDDLGGMGAGFAAAFGGELLCALGPEADPTSRDVAARLDAARIPFRAVRTGAPADWTLLLTSGPHGDKLGVGFRGCHASAATFGGLPEGACDLRVVAALPNRLAEEALAAGGAAVRMFAPAMRNVTDRVVPAARFARHVDVFCCSRREWEALEGREEVAWQVSLLAVTDGAKGSVVRFTTPEGEAGRVQVAAFPRLRPPRDTTRAGEIYAATLVSTLLDHGWRPGVSDPALVRAAAERASAAAALVLDRPGFGFPDPAEVDAAIRAGHVA